MEAWYFKPANISSSGKSMSLIESNDPCSLVQLRATFRGEDNRYETGGFACTHGVADNLAIDNP